MADKSLTKFDEHKDGLLAALPAHVDAKRFYHIALSTARSLPADVSETSLLLFCYGCARLGLVPDPVLGHVYPVPFKGQVTLIPGYRGYIELARRSGKIGSIHVDLVYLGEPFRHWITRDGPQLEHEPGLDRPEDPRKGCVAAYCLADVRGSWPQITVIPRNVIDKVDRSGENRGGNIWRDHWGEMAKKTVVRRASKFWPLTAELAQAVAWDEQADRGEQVLPPPDGPLVAEDAQRPLLLNNGTAAVTAPPPIDDDEAEREALRPADVEEGY